LNRQKSRKVASSALQLDATGGLQVFYNADNSIFA
jgi:hypothetical protein